jgi:uncharacterized protein YqgQ
MENKISDFLYNLENMKDLVNEVYESNLLDEKIWNKYISKIIDVEFMFYELDKILENER